MALRSPAELETEIAERRRAESDLRALQAQLEERVRQRTAELEEAVAALKAEVEAKERIERQMWESREQLRVVTDNAPVLLVLCDKERRYKFVNRAYAECNGLTPRDVVGRRIPDVVGERAYERLKANVDAALVAGERIEVEVESPYKETSGRLMHYTFLPHRSSPGSVEGFLAVIVDVTALRKAETLLRTITDTIPSLISYVDLEGRYRLNNQAYEQWFSHPRSEVVGRHMQEVLGESAWAVIRPRIEAALAGRTMRFEDQVPYKDAGTRWVDATYTPHLDAGGVIDGVVLLVNDNTDKKDAEAALRESEARFRMLLEGVPQLVWTCLPDGRCDYLSRQWVEYTGVPEADQLGYGWAEMLHADDRQLVQERWQHAVEVGDPLDVEFRIRSAGGEYRWFKTRAVRFTKDDGSGKWFGTNTDIHDSKLAEDELWKLNATLEERVVQRTAEVEQRAK